MLYVTVHDVKIILCHMGCCWSCMQHANSVPLPCQIAYCRVVQIPPEHGNVLEVNYKLPGYIATGVSGELTVTFTPKSNEDIDTAIEMLADTGPFFIPIK